MTANNRIAPADYPHHITSEYLDGWRAARIEQLLAERERHSLDDFARMQIDVFSIPGEMVAHRLARLRPPGQREVRAIERLKSWDHRLDADSVAGTIYHCFSHHFAVLVSEAAIGDADDAERWRSKSQLGFTPMNSAPWRFQRALLELWDEARPRPDRRPRLGRPGDRGADARARRPRGALRRATPRAGAGAARTRSGSRTRSATATRACRACSTGCCRAGGPRPAATRPSTRSATCRTTGSFTGIYGPAYRLLADLGDPTPRAGST